MVTHYKTHTITRLPDGRFRATYQSFRDLGTFASVPTAIKALDNEEARGHGRY